MPEPVEQLKMVLTRSALERLIGNEPQLEVLLTHSAVRQVISKRFSALQEHVDRATDVAIKNAFGSFVKTPAVSYRSPAKEEFVLSGAAKKAVDAYVADAVKEQMQQYMSDPGFLATVSVLINETLNTQVVSEINQQAEKRIREVVAKASDAVRQSVASAT